MEKIELDNGNIQLYLGDCLEVMPKMKSGIIDLILADLPYGTTRNKWDSIIPLDKLWEQYKRVRKSDAAIVLTAQTPFDKVLGVSNLDELRYEWIWEKERGTGFLNAQKMPLKISENVLVFYSELPTYNPCMVKLNKPYKHALPKNSSGNYGSVSTFDKDARVYKEYTHSYPTNIIRISRDDNRKGKHPTQKPVALMEYLIKTYTNENDLVLDNTMGSGTTGVACINTNRRFIGIEKEEKYFYTAVKRCQKALEGRNSA